MILLMNMISIDFPLPPEATGTIPLDRWPLAKVLQGSLLRFALDLALLQHLNMAARFLPFN